MGKPRWITLSLSTSTKDRDLNSENVNSGPLYYFIIQNDGDWKLDEDFKNENLPRLKIMQDSSATSVQYSDAIMTESENSSLLVGFPKTFAIYRPFFFTIPVGDTVSKIEMTVPMSLWPGFSQITQYYREGENAFQAGEFKTAVLSFNTIIKDYNLNIFPAYEESKRKRLAAFEQFYLYTTNSFSNTLNNTSIDLNRKIDSVVDIISRFQYVEDSLPAPSLGIAATDPSLIPLLDEAKSSLNRSTFVLDSLHDALDDLNVRWIITGSTGDKMDFRYRYMIETLAYAFSSIPFFDSSTSKLTFSISDDLSARLKKYNLDQSYETFLRLANKRWKTKQTLFPPDFLNNLERDSSQFALPFFDVLKAVADFYNTDFAGSTLSIFQVFRRSYDHELAGRLDELRILIETKERKVPPDALQHLSDGIAAEQRGETDSAAEHYRDAMLIAGDYAPAAFALGKLYERTGDSYKANNFFQKAISTDSVYYSAYRFLYLNYIRTANFKPMIDLLSAAIAHGNDFFNIHYYLGIAYNGAGLSDEAVKQYDRALELNPNSVDANIQEGIAYQNMKSYTKAREYYTRAIQIDPENQAATDNLKRLDELQKKF